MSCFIRCMSADGLIEMPPVSKVTALPTRPRCGLSSGGALSARYRITIMTGSKALALATPSSAPMPIERIRCSSSTSHSSPAFSARAQARVASSRGGRRLPGSFTSSRAWFCASTVATARSRAPGLPSSAEIGHALEPGLLAVGALVDVRLVVREPDSFNDRPHAGVRTGPVGRQDCHALCAGGAHMTPGAPGTIPPAGVAHLVGRSATNEHHASRTRTCRPVHNRHGLVLACELSAVGHFARQSTGEGVPVPNAGNPALVTFVDKSDCDVRLNALRAGSSVSLNCMRL